MDSKTIFERSVQCALNPKAQCFSECMFHNWARSIAGDESCGCQNAPIPMLISKCLTDREAMPTLMIPTGTYLKKRQKTRSYSLGVTRLLDFIKLYREFSKAPWASSHFDTNENIFFRLVSSHLHLIVGKEAAKTERQTLLRILAARKKLEGCGHLCWVTNRQQGKTTTLGRFLALLATTSPAGGLLCTVYSTSLDRSQELVKSAKQFLYWHQANGGKIKFVKDCERSFVLENKYARNEVAARPKNVESCRGDAPHCAIFDEIAFVDEHFWYKFAFPLVQVSGRVFSLITTPPPTDGFFAQFIEQVRARNKSGDHFFSLVNHSLACEECIRRNEGDRCCHRLHLIPPWKSILRFSAMKSLVPRNKQSSFAQEVFGVLDTEQKGYFPQKLVKAAVERTVSVTTSDFTHIYIGVDPASHGKSDLALCAIGVTARGLHVVIGLAAVNVARCEMSALSAVVRQFASRLRLEFPTCALVPIIESNNNEIAATTLLRAFGAIEMPFTRDRFSAYISEEIGVLTTAETKMSMIQQTYLCIINGALAFNSSLITADRTAFEPKANKENTEELKIELRDQLIRFADRPDGTVSGKTFAGDNDDMAMALMLSIYWRICILSSGK